jgi:voltage-gated potassium channel
MVNDCDTRRGRAFDLVIQGLIVVSLIAFTIETLPNLSPQLVTFLNGLETAIIIAFAAEYLLRIVVAENRFRYIFSFYGLIDLLSIVPSLISAGVDLRTVRLLRLFRTLKFVRYNRAIRRFHDAYVIAREELTLCFIVTMLLLYLSSVDIYYCENEAEPEIFASVFHCFWWSICTITTVGYGDVYPITPGGRFLTGVLLLIGIAIIAAPTGLFASAFVTARQLDDAHRNGPASDKDPRAPFDR